MFGAKDLEGKVDRLTQALENLYLAFMGPPTEASWWGRFGGATVAAAGTSTLITLIPPKDHYGVLLALGNWAATFDDGTGAVGIVFDVVRGNAPVFDLNNLNFAWGPTDAPEPVWVPFSPQEPLVIRARNLNAAAAIQACAVVKGIWYTVNGGLPRYILPWGRR